MTNSERNHDSQIYNSADILDVDTKTKLRKFFKKIKLSTTDNSGSNLVKLVNSGASFISEGKRTLYFDGQETETYLQLQNAVSSTHSKSQKYGRKYAEKILKEAIWQVMDSDKDPSNAAKEAVDFMNSKLSLPVKTWNIYYPVSGFDMRKSTSWKFGAIKIIKRTNRHFRNEVDSSVLDNRDVDYFAYISVNAIDADSALAMAQPTLDLHISVLNGLSSFLHSSNHDSVFSSYMPIGESVHSIALIGSNDSYKWKRCMSLSLAGFNPHVLRNSQFIKLFSVRTISRQLEYYDNDFFIKRILPAIKWFGRAMPPKTNEEIFLCYFLALESIYFESNYSEGNRVIDELRKRIYKLNFTNRRWLGISIEPYQRFGDLYKLRSDIVHRGGVEVGDNDIKLIRDLAMSSILKIMRYPYFRQMKASEQFEKWLTTPYRNNQC